MSDAYILNLFVDLRKQLLNVITGMSKSQWSLIPKGFSNHLHWQIGHVLTVTDELIFKFSGVGSRIPPGYETYFAAGTTPSNWSEHPPETKFILTGLEEQMMEISEKFEGKLTQRVADKNNFLQASVIGELFYVLIAHESMHLGMIIAMVKTLQNE